MAAIRVEHILVGRGDELRRLEAALAQAASGRGGVLSLAGETGIDKTRLGRETLVLAQRRGFQLLEGRAYPVESGLAYALVLDTLGPFLRRLDRSRLSILVSGLPDLGRLFGDLRLPQPESLGDPAVEKTRLFEATARLLERMAHQAPVFLFLDDLHWADPASLELLHYMARGLGDQPVLLLASYNPHEADSTRGLRAMLKSLQRMGLAEELAISRLTPESQTELVRGMLGGEAPPELIGFLDAHAAGTPLFLEAIVRSLIDAGRLARVESRWSLDPGIELTLPSGVRELIQERLDRLAQDDRHLLDLIAVCGDAVGFSVLRQASGLVEDVLLTALQRLRSAGLVSEGVDGPEVVYGIPHPLVQEVAYAELSEIGRRRTHALVAGAMERLCPDDMERLARHYRAAGLETNSDRALEVLLEAGRRALELHANEEAAQHFLAALVLIRAGHRGDLLPWLLERLGEAWQRVGEVGAAVGLWAEALESRRRAADGRSMARLRRLLAAAEWGRGHREAARAHLVAGLETLAGSVPCEEAVDLLHTQVTICSRLGDVEGVAAAVEELLKAARYLALPRAEVEAQLAQAHLATIRMEYARACQLALAALSSAESAGDPLLTLWAHEAILVPALWMGDHSLARRHAEQELDLARRLGAPILESVPRVNLGFADLLSGDWDAALRRATQTIALARRVDRPRVLAEGLAVRALVFAWRGDLAAAEGCVAEAQAAIVIPAGGRASSSRSTELEKVAEAVKAVDPGNPIRVCLKALAASPVAGWDTPPPFILAAVGEAQAVVGQLESALDTASKLASLASHWPSLVGTCAAWVQGLALGVLGEREEAMVCLARAAEQFALLEMPFEAARARLQWATLAIDSEVDAAIVEARDSFEAFQRLGARRYADQARRILGRLGVRPSPARRISSSSGLLSARELQVARLVAEGLTNAEIAERLVLSRRTVTTHLERIYARLKIDSRQALVRYVTQDSPPGPGDRIA